MAKKKKEYSEEDGVWRTIGGRRVFIKKGQSLSDAMKESGKFKKVSDVKRGEYQDLEKELKANKTEYLVRQDAKEQGTYIGDMTNEVWAGKHVEGGPNSYKEKNPIQDMANDRIKEKENTLANDKAMLEGMKRNGINEIQGWTQKDFEDRIKKNEEYLKVAKDNKSEKEYKEGEYSFEGKTRQDKINDLYDKMQNEKNIFKKGEIQEEINMLKDNFEGTKEEYRNQIAKEQEKRLAEYQKEKEERQTQIKQQKLDKAIRTANTQKSLKELANDGIAKDITNLSDEETKKLRDKHGHLEVMRVIHGTYGMNGAILKSYETGEYFVITSRNGNLFYWV